jgi:hypothetical protein
LSCITVREALASAEIGGRMQIEATLDADELTAPRSAVISPTQEQIAR